MFELDAASAGRLEGVHPNLGRGVRLAATLSTVRFCILPGGGVRTREQAAANAKAGTGVLNSLHIIQADGFGHAVDLVAVGQDGKPSWDLKLYKDMHPAIYQAFDDLGIAIQNGSDWDMDGVIGERGEWDWPHWQLPIAAKLQAAIAAMRRRIAERQK